MKCSLLLSFQLVFSFTLLSQVPCNVFINIMVTRTKEQQQQQLNFQYDIIISYFFLPFSSLSLTSFSTGYIRSIHNPS